MEGLENSAAVEVASMKGEKADKLQFFYISDSLNSFEDDFTVFLHSSDYLSSILSFCFHFLFKQILQRLPAQRQGTACFRLFI